MMYMPFSAELWAETSEGEMVFDIFPFLLFFGF